MSGKEELIYHFERIVLTLHTGYEKYRRAVRFIKTFSCRFIGSKHIGFLRISRYFRAITILWYFENVYSDDKDASLGLL